MDIRKILTVFMLLFASLTVAIASGQRDEEGDGEDSEEALHEIDNYDFLYNDSYYDYGSDVVAIEELMDEAFAHLGARYRSGSKGPNAFDCSGFTSYVFSRFDMSIGASSRDQYAKQTPVDKEDLQRGDLVFFTSPGSGRAVGHVGIVVDVDPVSGTFSFIHASSRGGVKVDESTDGYYARRYVGARRVLQ